MSKRGFCTRRWLHRNRAHRYEKKFVFFHVGLRLKRSMLHFSFIFVEFVIGKLVLFCFLLVFSKVSGLSFYLNHKSIYKRKPVSLFLVRECHSRRHFEKKKLFVLSTRRVAIIRDELDHIFMPLELRTNPYSYEIQLYTQLVVVGLQVVNLVLN